MTKDLLGRQTLSFGTEMLWEVLPGHQVASLGFFYSVGSRNDPLGKEGLSHFVEHFLFKGTRSYSPSSLVREIERLGGEINAYTDRAEIAFTCTVPVSAWETALKVLCELCFFPTFPRTEFLKEKNVILSEIQSANEDPEEVSYDQFLARLDPGHPELHPVGGTVSSLDNITYEDLLQWKTAYLCDDVLTFVWTGDLNPQTIALKFESLRGKTPSKSAHKGGIPLIQPQAFLSYQNSDFQMLQVVLGWHFPENPTQTQALFLQVFSTLWAETMISRLFQNLRENLGLCYSVGSQVWETEARLGVHTFLSTTPEQALDLLRALKFQIKELETPPSILEWEDAKNALAGSLQITAERSEARMFRLFANWSRWHCLPSLSSTYQEIMVLPLEPFWSTWKKFCLFEKTSLLLWGKGAEKLFKKAGWS